MWQCFENFSKIVKKILCTLSILSNFWAYFQVLGHIIHIWKFLEILKNYWKMFKFPGHIFKCSKFYKYFGYLVKTFPKFAKKICAHFQNFQNFWAYFQFCGTFSIFENFWKLKNYWKMDKFFGHMFKIVLSTNFGYILKFWKFSKIFVYIVTY
jgi:hypothetical protein